jgi:hypothetical protein
MLNPVTLALLGIRARGSYGGPDDAEFEDGGSEVIEAPISPFDAQRPRVSRRRTALADVNPTWPGDESDDLEHDEDKKTGA